MSRDDVDRAYRQEQTAALALHDDAREYLAADMPAWEFLESAYRYGLARAERERLQAELWGA